MQHQYATTTTTTTTKTTSPNWRRRALKKYLDGSQTKDSNNLVVIVTEHTLPFATAEATDNLNKKGPYKWPRFATHLEIHEKTSDSRC
jgi:hypothetical protein